MDFYNPYFCLLWEEGMNKCIDLLKANHVHRQVAWIYWFSWEPMHLGLIIIYKGLCWYRIIYYYLQTNCSYLQRLPGSAMVIMSTICWEQHPYGALQVLWIVLINNGLTSMPLSALSSSLVYSSCYSKQIWRGRLFVLPAIPRRSGEEGWGAWEENISTLGPCKSQNQVSINYWELMVLFWTNFRFPHWYNMID